MFDGINNNFYREEHFNIGEYYQCIYAHDDTSNLAIYSDATVTRKDSRGITVICDVMFHKNGGVSYSGDNEKHFIYRSRINQVHRKNWDDREFL
jgi:ankyrin repeat protein